MIIIKDRGLFDLLLYNWRRPYCGWNVLLMLKAVYHMHYTLKNSLPVPHGCVCQGVGVGVCVGVFMHMHACSCVGAHVWETSKRWGRKSHCSKSAWCGNALLQHPTSDPDWPQILGNSSRKPEIVRQGRWRSGWRPWCKQHRCQRSCTPCQQGCPQTAH